MEKTTQESLAQVKPAPVYAPSFAWGRGYVVSESDEIGDWVDGEVTTEMITAAFTPTR